MREDRTLDKIMQIYSKVHPLHRCQTGQNRSLTPTIMRLLQPNLHRSRIVNTLMGRIAVERRIDAFIISEQYRLIARVSWFEDETGTAAFWLPEPARDIHTYLKTAFLTPSDEIQHFKTKVVFKLQGKQIKLLQALQRDIITTLFYIRFSIQVIAPLGLGISLQQKYQRYNSFQRAYVTEISNESFFRYS